MRLGLLAVSAGILLVLTLLAMLMAAWFFGALENRTTALEPTPLPLIELRPTPPPPRLQPNIIDRRTGEEDMTNLRAREDEILNGYDWVDRDAGVVRVPIDKAIELLVEEGAGAEEPAK
jgi:hypothetical protein